MVRSPSQEAGRRRASDLAVFKIMYCSDVGLWPYILHIYSVDNDLSIRGERIDILLLRLSKTKDLVFMYAWQCYLELPGRFLLVSELTAFGLSKRPIIKSLRGVNAWILRTLKKILRTLKKILWTPKKTIEKVSAALKHTFGGYSMWGLRTRTKTCEKNVY